MQVARIAPKHGGRRFTRDHSPRLQHVAHVVPEAEVDAIRAELEARGLPAGIPEITPRRARHHPARRRRDVRLRPGIARRQRHAARLLCPRAPSGRRLGRRRFDAPGPGLTGSAPLTSPMRAAARARQPRHHEHLPPRHRQQRDHQHRPRTSVDDDFRHRRAPVEAIKGVQPARSATRPKRQPHPAWRIARPTPQLGAGPALAAPRVAAVPLATSFAPSRALAYVAAPRPRERVLSAESGAHVDVAVTFRRPRHGVTARASLAG